MLVFYVKTYYKPNLAPCNQPLRPEDDRVIVVLDEDEQQTHIQPIEDEL